MTRDHVGVLAVLASSAIGGVAGGATRYVIHATDPVTLGVFRYGTGFLILLPIALLLKSRWPKRRDCGPANRVSVAYRTGLRRANRKLENNEQRPGLEKRRSCTRLPSNLWPETASRQPNPPECRRFSHTGKSQRRDCTGWLRMQSQSNLSLHPNSLICGNLQGILAICREFGLEAHLKEPQDQMVTAKIPYAINQRILAANWGFWRHEQRICPTEKSPRGWAFQAPWRRDGRDLDDRRRPPIMPAMARRWSSQHAST